MNKYLILFIVSIASIHYTTAQEDSTRIFSERLLIDIPVIDVAFAQKAAIASYNKKFDLPSGYTGRVGFGNYVRSYENLSMPQALAITTSLHNTNYYFQNKLWNRVLPAQNRRKKFYNRVAANAAAGIVDYALAYKVMVFSPVWLHEEFHRNGLALKGIGSYNDTYFKLNGKGEAGGSISKVKDEDLVRFKQEAPVQMVRSFEAGIESQYLLLRNMQKENFFQKTNYPNIIMNILLTREAVNYVNQFRQKDYDNGIDSMNAHGQVLKERDFVGWDFTAWVYDMFRPNESYSARGIHPSGNGVDRIVKRSKLTPEEDRYLVKMGKLQYINFINPALLGIDRIRFNANTGFTFAARHYLTSFGYDINVDLFLDRKGKNWLLGFHGFRNKEKFYPGLELYSEQLPLKIGRLNLQTDITGMLWIQPKGESFYASSGKAGGLLQFKTQYKIGKSLSTYLELGGKTSGWVAGNPFLKSNLNARTGLTIDINNKIVK